MSTLKKSSVAGTVMALVLAGALGAFTLRSNEISADQKGGTMRVVRLYTGPDNKSHFEDIQVPLKDGGKVGFISELYKATGVVFRENTGDYNYDFHPAPRRQYVVNLDGEVEIEVGDGTRRILRTGDILLAEDTTGQGHISRAVAGKPRKSLFITLD
jgi:opacity protein-like surface antigen